MCVWIIWSVLLGSSHSHLQGIIGNAKQEGNHAVYDIQWSISDEEVKGF